MMPHDFNRTVCACAECTRCCKKQPGPLIPGDYERIQKHLGVSDAEMEKLFCASPGALVQDSFGVTRRIGSIVPQTRKQGRCVFLDENDRCKIHEVAPFGCAYFDTHMSRDTAHRRSLYAVRLQETKQYQELRAKLPYARVYNPRGY
jgi:Fe-S-cluster containining protein